MNNILICENCYGCGVCILICPKKIISLELSTDGFYQPYISDIEACTQCGKCLSVCAFNDKKVSEFTYLIPESFAGWSKNNENLIQCSSGGIAFEIGTYLIDKGYKACGVKYNAELKRAEHFMAATIDDFKASIGSKYIPSYTIGGLAQINANDKFFITGTPCQIDSIRKYIRKKKIEDNFVLLDFFCHGLPSMNLWMKYLEMISGKTENVPDVSWRNKDNGWHHSYKVRHLGNDGNSYSSIKGSKLFYKFFLKDVCLGKACYKNCKYKMTASAADIRIGDLWGNAYKSNEVGVSGVIVLTSKGHDIIENIDTCLFKKEKISVITSGQMKRSPKEPYIRKYILNAFLTDMPLKQIANTYLNLYDITMFPQKVLKKILTIAKSAKN